MIRVGVNWGKPILCEVEVDLLIVFLRQVYVLFVIEEIDREKFGPAGFLDARAVVVSSEFLAYCQQLYKPIIKTVSHDLRHAFFHEPPSIPVLS
jgi:hypothetical protein